MQKKISFNLDENYTLTTKILVIGDHFTGKTTFFKKFC
jgi:hypothetical protein